MHLFTEQINNWDDWGAIFQSIPAFKPLTEYILRKEDLRLAEIENLTPGTNAVFKAGDYVVKIFAPAESGMDQTPDLPTELFAMRRAHALGISVPKLIADGFVEDKYCFAYIIMEYINGIEFTDAVKNMTDDEKVVFGRKLREICDRMNTPCQPFNNIDIINDKSRQKRWGKYADSFKAERVEYIKSHNFGKKVFVHGDIGGDNIIVSVSGEIYLIDFADAVLAPLVYEHQLVAVDVFTFDRALLQGFFGDYTNEELIEICFNGLLIHDFGGDTIEEHIADPCEIRSLRDLRERIYKLIMTKKGATP
jgi:tRNA A-37 threonylcarbamoyl transferase component Bud32